MRLSIFSLAFACLISCVAVAVSMASNSLLYLFSNVPRLFAAQPFAFRSEPRSIFDTRRMGLA